MSHVCEPHPICFPGFSIFKFFEIRLVLSFTVGNLHAEHYIYHGDIQSMVSYYPYFEVLIDLRYELHGSNGLPSSIIMKLLDQPLLPSLIKTTKKRPLSSASSKVYRIRSSVHHTPK